jgi:hypothetical protein
MLPNTVYDESSSLVPKPILPVASAGKTGTTERSYAWPIPGVFWTTLRSLTFPVIFICVFVGNRLLAEIVGLLSVNALPKRITEH